VAVFDESYMNADGAQNGSGNSNKVEGLVKNEKKIKRERTLDKTQVTGEPSKRVKRENITDGSSILV
jgi:hypothetical protein